MFKIQQGSVSQVSYCSHMNIWGRYFHFFFWVWCTKKRRINKLFSDSSPALLPSIIIFVHSIKNFFFSITVFVFGAEQDLINHIKWLHITVKSLFNTCWYLFKRVKQIIFVFISSYHLAIQLLLDYFNVTNFHVLSGCYPLICMAVLNLSI